MTLYPNDQAFRDGRRSALQNNQIVAALGILLAVAAVYYPVVHHEFLFWDDDVYVTKNPLVRSLSWDHITGIFSSYVSGNYHPLTVLGHALQFQFFGLNPRGYHAWSLALHLVNVLLVFRLAFLWSGARAVPALVTAALFGLHPTRVETVAWISDQKDLLSALFILWALISYEAFVIENTLKRYFATLLLFLAALLCKGGALVFPLALVLSDYRRRRAIGIACWLEKIPFLALSLVFGMVAVDARTHYQHILKEQHLGLAIGFVADVQRLVDYYLLRVIAPFSRGELYPVLPSTRPLAYPAFLKSLAVLMLLIAAVGVSALRTRTVVFGALFFLVMLSPVFGTYILGLSADRFTYLPFLGLAFVGGELFGAAWERIPGRLPWLRNMAATAVLTAVLASAAQVRADLGLWRDSFSMLNSALEWHGDKGQVYAMRATVYLDRGLKEEALNDLASALRENPLLDDAWRNYGVLLAERGDFTGGLAAIDQALELGHRSPEAFDARGLIFLQLRDYERAVADFSRSLEGGRKNARTLNNRGTAYTLKGDRELALADYDAAIALDPGYAGAYFNRARVHGERGDQAAARRDAEVARALSKAP